jgi:hypothetical protein
MRSGIRSRVGLGYLIAALVVLAGPGARAASALTISLDYSLDTNGFFGSAAARDALERAVDYYEAFTDTLSAITPGGVNSWNANFTHPGTGVVHSIADLSVAADEIIVFAGGRSLGGSLGVGGPGGFSASGTASFLDSVVGRSQPGALGPPAGRTDFGPWGGAISFDTGASWHFGLTTAGLDAGEADFLSVALHELGHLLGFGTVPSWNNLVSGGSFTGAGAVAVFGGNVPLDGGAAHWADGTPSGGQPTLMDPSLVLGTRALLTELDYAGLEDIGWQVVPLAPEPGDAVLLTAAGFAWVLTRRR